MPIAFSTYSIIVKRSALQNAFDTNHDEISKTANSLLQSKLIDEYLVGIESTSEDLEFEKVILNSMGLIWNDGIDCIDYYIPSEGTFTATWLRYERLKYQDCYFSCYQHIDDCSNAIIAYDAEITDKFSRTAIALTRSNWALIARDELNRLVYPSMNRMLEEISRNDRVCPNPIFWNELHELVIKAAINENAHPPLPLILGGWWHSSNESKAHRLVELLTWADVHKVSNVAWAYINALNEDEWHHKS